VNVVEAPNVILDAETVVEPVGTEQVVDDEVDRVGEVDGISTVKTVTGVIPPGVLGVPVKVTGVVIPVVVTVVVERAGDLNELAFEVGNIVVELGDGVYTVTGTVPPKVFGVPVTVYGTVLLPTVVVVA
jgi:hypothetical protein